MLVLCLYLAGAVDGLKIYYQNVRGLRTKSHSFLSNIINSDYDVICLTETWLNSDFFSGEFFDPRYNVYRRDRCGREVVRGGGVLVAVRRGLCSERRDDLCAAPAHEELWVTVSPALAPSAAPLPRRGRPAALARVHFACTYFAHNDNHRNSLQCFFDNSGGLIHDSPDDIFILVGDFNVTHAGWKIENFSSHLSIIVNDDNIARDLSDFLDISGLYQYNHCTNINGRILDLVMSNVLCSLFFGCLLFSTYAGRPTACIFNVHH